LNLFTSLDVKFHKLNRYKDILPYVHNRVILKECPVILASQLSDLKDSPILSDEVNNKLVQEDLEEMEMHGSDLRLRTFFNASYISSMVKSRQLKGPSFIASSSPVYSGNITKNAQG